MQTEDKAVCAETFCGIELFVPDYTANGFIVNRELFGHAWFQAAWGFEESQHALVFRQYLTRSGRRTEEQYAAFEKKMLAKVWELPFPTRRQMICYGALQEAATYLIHKAQRDRARREGDALLEKIYFYVSRDEAAHMGFYREVLTYELEEDRQGALADLAYVILNFRMPGVSLLPDYDARLGVSGVGITPQELAANCALLITAGHETTTNLIGNGLLALLRHPRGAGAAARAAGADAVGARRAAAL